MEHSSEQPSHEILSMQVHQKQNHQRRGDNSPTQTIIYSANVLPDPFIHFDANSQLWMAHIYFPLYTTNH